MVLISKVNALMRRTSLREESKRIIRCRNLSFYPEEMKLLINNEEGPGQPFAAAQAAAQAERRLL